MMTLHSFIQLILHLDSYLLSLVNQYGSLTYIILFAIIFCETGLVVFPFLPGDSLLFAAGSIAANQATSLNIQLLFFMLVIASVLGNKTNYLIGRLAGPQVFNQTKSRWFKPKYLREAHNFYNVHGGKTIIIARFLPIVRTFAPFVAGVSAMRLARFSFYNILSAFLWIGSLLFAGYFFGHLPFFKDNFSILVYGIIALSLLPPLWALLSQRRPKAKIN